MFLNGSLSRIGCRIGCLEDWCHATYPTALQTIPSNPKLSPAILSTPRHNTRPLDVLRVFLETAAVHFARDKIASVFWDAAVRVSQMTVQILRSPACTILKYWFTIGLGYSWSLGTP